MAMQVRRVVGRVGGALQAWANRSARPEVFGPEDAEAFVAVVALEGLRDLERSLGRSATDEILAVMADKVLRHLPQGRLGRVGHGAIELAFQSPSDLAAEAVLLRLRRLLSERFEVGGRFYHLPIVIGYASGDLRDAEATSGAELAVELARVHPSRIAAHAPGEQTDAAERLALLGDLRHAIQCNELFLTYQPKLHTRDMKVSSAEALLRWRHPRRGLVPPDRFITLAEQTGVIGDITRWVITRAIDDQRRLAADGHAVEIHVNISGRELPDPAFAAWALDAVKSAAGTIGFEITETAVIAEPEAALRNLRAFAAAGIRIAIDDYGSGLSSLAYLKELPARELKIDRGFISSLTTSHRDPLLVRSTIDLAHALEMEVTAEGVEDAATLSLLRIMGCDMIQGYLISKALSLDELAALLRDKPVHTIAPMSLMAAASA